MQFPDKAWTRLSRSLAVALGDLDEDEWLILSIKGSNRFVQVMNQGAHGWLAETVSDYYLPDGQHLTESQYRALLDLGWHAPTGLPNEFGLPGGSPNYFVDLASPIDPETLSMLAIATFIRVHGARHPGHLEYSARSRSGESIRFPHLKLRRER